MTRRIDPLIAAILLSSATALVPLVPLRDAAGSLPLIPFAATLVLFMVPGALMVRWFFGEELRGFAAIPVAFAISMGIFGLLGVPALISHTSIEVYLWSAGTVLAIFLAAAALITLRGERIAPEEDRDDPSAGWLWAPFAVLGGILVFLSTRRVPADGDDIWVYLSWVRDFASADRLAQREPYFGDETGELSRVQVNGWLLEQAALARVSGIDTIEFVLRYLTPTLVIVALLAVYALARTLLKSERAAVVCASVFALFHLVFIEPSVHNIGAELVARIPEDKHAARFLILPIALLCSVLYIEGRKLRYLVLFGFFCWAIIAVHPIVLPALGLCMLGFGLAHVAAHPLRRETWTGMVALALAMWSVVLGPMLLLFAGRSPSDVLYSADINSTPPKVLDNLVFVNESWRHIYEFADGSYIMHPWLLLNPVILGTYLLGIPFLLWRVRDTPAAQLLLGGLVVVTVAVYVPPVATFVGEELIVPGQLWRLAWPISLLALLTAGWMVWEGTRYAQARLGGRRASRVLPLLILLAALVAVAVPSAAKGVELYREREDARSANYHPDPIYPWIQANITQPSVLFAPNDANTALPAYSTSVDVVSLRGNAIIEEREALEESAGSKIYIPQRYLDVYHFFSDSTAEERREILRRHEADYLMVHTGSSLHEDLKGDPGFRAVEDAPRENYSLYEVDLRELGE